MMSEDPNRRQQFSSEQQSYGQPSQHEQPPYGQPEYGQPQLEYVSVGPRFLALLIDSVILFAVDYPLPFLFRAAQGTWGVFILAFSPGLLALLYLIVMEATQGATLGKMALGLRVVKTDGSPINWSQSIIRNLLRIVDCLFCYLVGAILVWNSPLRQRFGDRVAHTVVVRRRR